MHKIQSILQNYHPSVYSKSLSDICECRTPARGGYMMECRDCGKTVYHYRSCGNRNCPVCQSMKQLTWVESRKSEALNVTYYHIVFTIPSELNVLCIKHPEKMYDALFKAASSTLLDLAKDKRRFGAKPGFVCVLHTWGSNLSLHPHLHCLMPGCGIRDQKLVLPKHGKFMFPVKVMSKLFRGKYLAILRELGFDFPHSLYNTDWVVYLKPSPGKGENVIEYLGRYTHRVAISDSRITAFGDDYVSFNYKDYRDHDRVKSMTLTSTEFCRRFLMHILPSGFRKIRFYGFLSNRRKDANLKLLRRLLNSPALENAFKGLSHYEILKLVKNIDVTVCPCCGSHNVRISPLMDKFGNLW